MQEEQTSEHQVVFRLPSGLESNVLTVFVGEVYVNLEMLVGSGASNYIIDEETWENLKAKKLKCKSDAIPVDGKLYTYASDKPLPWVKGRFTCEVTVDQGRSGAEFNS